MEYLAKVKLGDDVYEAYADVRQYDGEYEVDFSTSLAYVNDEVTLASDLPEMVIDKLFDEACDMYNTDDGADAAYDAMRDA